jgi:hypothetical protein
VNERKEEPELNERFPNLFTPALERPKMTNLDGKSEISYLWAMVLPNEGQTIMKRLGAFIFIKRQQRMAFRPALAGGLALSDGQGCRLEDAAVAVLSRRHEMFVKIDPFSR